MKKKIGTRIAEPPEFNCAVDENNQSIINENLKKIKNLKNVTKKKAPKSLKR